MDFKPGGMVGACGMVDIRELGDPHPWKTEFIVPLRRGPEHSDFIAHVVLVKAFQEEIDLLDTSWLDEQ